MSQDYGMSWIVDLDDLICRSILATGLFIASLFCFDYNIFFSIIPAVVVDLLKLADA